MKRTTTTNLVVADRKGVAVFEVTPEYVLVRRPDNGVCICTNHFCTEQLRPRVGLNLFGTYGRYRMLDDAGRAQEKHTIADLHDALHAVREEKETLQTMIFEPATLRLHLAIGQCPSSAGALKRLDLMPFLRGE